MNKKTGMFLLAMLLFGTLVSAAPLDVAQDKICGVLESVYTLLLYIASGVAALVIVAMGLSWVASADDAKARKAAKMGVIHAVVGLIIVSIAIAIVVVVLPEGSDCIVDWPGYANVTSP